MSKKPQLRTTSRPTGTLRERSESMASATSGDIGRMDAKDIQALVHELRLRQIELELRNEEMVNGLAQIVGTQAELRQFNEQLEIRVKDRSSELLKTQGHLQEHVFFRRKIEEELRRQAQTTMALLDTAHVIILQLDRDAGIVHFNRFMAELSGYELKDLVGKSWFEAFLPPEIHGTLREVFHKAVAGEPTRGNVNPILTKDGRRRLIEWYDKSLVDAEGRIVGVLCTGLDVTERYQHEEDQALLAAIVRSSNDAITGRSVDGIIQSWNEAAVRTYGYSREEAIGRHINLIVPLDRHGEVEMLREHIQRGQSLEQFETVRMSKTGRLIDVSLTESPLRDSSGTIVGSSTTTRDITQRKQMEAQLRESVERFQSVLNTATDAIIIIDELGSMTGVNPATERMFGYQEHEMVGQNVNMLMPAPYHAKHDSYIANYLRTGQAKIIGTGREVVGRRKDGTTIPIDLAVSAFRSGTGPMFTGIIRDISERKEMEHHLADARIEEQRYFAQELHDGVGGQLVGIGMLADHVKEKLLQEKRPEAQEVAALLRYIQEALAQLRRLSHGLMPVEVGPDGLLLALGQLAERMNAAGNVDCRFECPDHVVVRSPADATHLYRIAQEAVSNALRHGKPTRINIHLATNGPVTTLRILDNGSGIRQPIDGQGGMGLRTMKYRASQIGATLTNEKV